MTSLFTALKNVIYGIVYVISSILLLPVYTIGSGVSNFLASISPMFRATDDETYVTETIDASNILGDDQNKLLVRKRKKVHSFIFHPHFNYSGSGEEK